MARIATLEKDVRDNPSFTITLTGNVRKMRVVMSFDTITQVAPFDSLPDQEYVYPPERHIFDNATTESLDRKMIPHCHLITTLMRLQGALHQDTFYMVKHHKRIVLNKLSYQEWSYTTTNRRFVLKDKKMKQRIEGLLDHVQPLEGKDEGEEGNDEEEEEGDDGAT
ncbi:hypothetical protein L1987_57959 [Smallanthus sonchifolius]|uniref:Uncharacterized protein n=1 Tax=Smallanthus sonchifolius TaxID=185202 RepID=A0ACB9DDY9_9ASTR|nr:hypothetical protein L1987_57959 [Smallanthus sonchifolius]